MWWCIIAYLKPKYFEMKGYIYIKRQEKNKGLLLFSHDNTNTKHVTWLYVDTNFIFLSA